MKPEQYYLGLDRDSELVDRNVPRGNMEFRVFDFAEDKVTSLPGKFDLVVMLAVIEHFEFPHRVLQAVATLLEGGGKIVLTTPAPWTDSILEFGSKLRIFAQDKDQHYDLLGRDAIKVCAQQTTLNMVSFSRFLLGQNQLAILQKT